MKTFASAAPLTSAPTIGTEPTPGRGTIVRRPTISRTALAFAQVFLLTAAIASLPTGCGSPGSPQAPSLKLPAPPTDLTVSRAGDAVTLRWTMPRRATDRVPLAGDQRVVICRSLGAARPCTAVGTVLLAPGLPATYIDTLTGTLLAGPPQLLTYTVLLENRAQHGAGPSNAVFSAAGAAPPAITSLQVDAQPGGIVLRWPSLERPAATSANMPSGQIVPATYLLRLHRTRILTPGESGKPSPGQTRSGIAQPSEQTLEVPLAPAPASTLAHGWLQDHVIDRNATLNHTYRYTVECVAQLRLEGHLLQISGPESAPAMVVALDLFPPAVPRGLEAVADGPGRAIDLSWTADADTDLAGYFVYRRLVGPQRATRESLARVSGASPLANSAWRDASAQPGRRFAYSVSAVDSSGNESGRSPEVEEELPGDTPATPSSPHR